MGWLMAAVYDRLTAKGERGTIGEWRDELLADVRGDVIEIGSGTGHNLSRYSDGVDRLVLTEPDRHMRAKLDARLAEVDGPAQVEVSEAGVDDLGFPDDTFDVAVSTLVLCSVPDPAAALAEIRRVLKPGGRLVYLEHVAAVEDPNRHKWQRRVEPLWKRVVGNCHLTRVTDQRIVEAGFEPVSERREEHPEAPAVARLVIRGEARAPS